MQDFRELQVWRRSHALTLSIYTATGNFPSSELYGLTSQLRRCCASIPANLAEGCGRHGDMDFARFCSIAMGSASELDYHLLLAKDLKLITPTMHHQLAKKTSEIKRMLTGLMQTLRSNHKSKELKADS